jgi:hypothetical protein
VGGERESVLLSLEMDENSYRLDRVHFFASFITPLIVPEHVVYRANLIEYAMKRIQ